ncbi:MAG TPA: ABC transporter substrate-binding protein [Thermoleophilaceae bacterium]
MRRVRLVALGLLVVAVTTGVAQGQAPKRGGVLNAMLGEDPPSFSIHESATISGLWPVMPCYSNLVLFDQLKAAESAETVLPELAERWSWQDNDRNLVFFLRKNVKWHDGQPFTARDVKYTFDVVREAPDAPAKLRINPRKDWYVNVEAIEAPDPHTVIFRLKRPQPALLLMLASGYSPVYPAHVPLAELRQRCVGTGPFRLKQYLRGQHVELERNPDYFVPGRPYLDGIRYPVITERSTRLAALQAGRLDVAMPLEMTRTMAETAKRGAPSLVVAETGQIGSDNVVMNHKKPPFDNLTVRRAISLAMDRQAFVQAVRQGGARVGTAVMPRPFGAWGVPDKEMRALPGYRDAAQDKGEARRLLAAAGFGPGKPLRVELTTRAFAIYIDLASFVADQLRQVNVEATVKQIETSQFFPAMARRDYLIGANLTAAAIDDPDVYFYENYKCGTSRNYTDYCSEETDRLIELQSQELDRDRRQKLVWEIQRRLEADVARPMLGWRNEYFTQWPHVKNLVPHHSLYNYGRMQDVWLDR